MSEALGEIPGAFSPLYINMVRAGESSGTMELVLDRLAEMIEKQQQVMQRITSAMTYPIFMTLIGAGILLFLITYIVPTIAGLFADMKQVLPLPTRVLIGTSNVLKLWWWLIPICITILILGFRHVRSTVSGRYAIDRTLLSACRSSEISCASFLPQGLHGPWGCFWKTGFPCFQRLKLLKISQEMYSLPMLLKRLSIQVRQGRGLATSLDAARQFPALFIQMIQVGEQSGALESLLKKVADLFENEVESALMRMASLLEPIMILIMGVMVGFIVLSICLPIFEMNQLIQ